MKIIKILLLGFLILILLSALAIFIFIKTFDINRFKPQILSQASSVLNRQVDFSRASLQLSLERGINLKLHDLCIAEDPEFGETPFLTVREASLGVDVMGYVFDKKVDVSSIIINGATINIIRTKDGRINVMSIAQSQETAGNPASQQSAQAAVTVESLPPLFVSSLQFINSKATYIDRSFDPAVNLEVGDFNVHMHELSLNRNFPISVEAAVFSESKNIELQGIARADIPESRFMLSSLQGSVDLAKIDPEKVSASLPMVQSDILPQELKGALSISAPEIIIGEKGLVELRANASLSNARMIFDTLASPVNDIRADMQINKDTLVIEKASARIGEGEITLSGEVSDYISAQNFNVSLEAKELKLQELLAQKNARVKVEGVISNKVTLQGQGFSAESLKSSLAGSGEAAFRDVVLKDLNVLRVVLDKISVIPRLSQKIESNLPEKYKEKLTQQDTALKDFKLPLAVEEGKMIINNINIGADEFSFLGSGAINLDTQYALEGAFLIPRELSEAIVGEVQELQYLLTNDGQIYFPLRVTGEASDVNFKVDSEYIAKRILIEQGTKQLFKALQKSLGKDGEEPAQEPGQQEQQPQQEQNIQEQKEQSEEQPGQELSTEEKVIDLLRGILSE